MPAPIPRSVKFFNVFIDGVGHRGTVTELELPELAKVTVDHRSGGMDSVIKLDMGLEPPMAKFTFAEYDADTLSQVGLFGVDHMPFTIRGGIPRAGDKADDATSMVANMQGQFVKVEPGSWKPGEANKVKYECALSYYKLTYDGTVICEIDIPGMKRIVGGVDQLESMRAAIGV